ncbi:MAG: CotH kinase family protein [Bacteroidaceae bacterium]|nr:CotH kinase family protein [Bacteroidaceae bacterium]
MKQKKLLTIALLAMMTVPSSAQFPQFPGFPQGGMFPGGMMGGFPQGGMSPGGMMGGMMGGGYRDNGVAVEFSSSDLPIVIIDTKAPIGTSGKSDASMKIIDNKNGRNRVDDTPGGYDGRIGIKLRGNSSLSFDQKSFTIETRDEDGNDADVSLLGMPAESDWALVAAYNDISMMRNSLAYRMWEDMGHWAPHTRMVELVVDGKYQGVYTFTETIKRGKNRLSIAKLKPEDNDGTELTGGYILRIDAYDNDDLTFVSKVPGITRNAGGMQGGFPGMMGGGIGASGGNVVWTIRTPDKDKITREQREYIQNYIDEFEKTVMSDHFRDRKTGYAKYIDVESFVDYLIHTEVSLNADGLKRSAYFYKTKQNEDGSGGKLHAGSVWDYNLAYGNCNFCNADNVRAWVHEGGETSPTPAFWKRLLEDPDFLALVKTRYRELRKTVLSQKNIDALIDSYAETLQEAQKRQFSKYRNLLVPSAADRRNSGGFPGMGSGPGMGFPGMGAGGVDWFAAYRVSSYEEEIGILKKWFSERLAFLDSQW